MNDEFPANNIHPPKPAKDAAKKIEPVVVSGVARRKQPLGKRLAENFVSGDGARGVWGYVLFDVLIPAAKDMVVDAGTEALQRSFYGDSRAGSRRNPRPGPFGTGHTTYNQMYKSPNVPARSSAPGGMSRKARATHNFDEILLNTKVEAEEVLDRMFDLVSQFEVVTVADLYELCGQESSHADHKWGWTDLRGAGATRLRGGQYLLDLTKPEYLE